MLKQAIEYIIGLRKPEITEIRGEMYSDKPLNRISYNPKAAPIKLTTLSSFLQYVNSNVDYITYDNIIIHVKSPTEISMYSELDTERERETLVEVKAMLPNIKFGDFIPQEDFCIMVQSGFVSTEERSLLLKFAGTVESGTVANYSDDGITQKAVVKKGLTSKEDALVPSPIALKPFRTFIEVEQPLSSFIFRMKEGVYGGVGCALFEADGGAWRQIAMRSIAEYIKENLIEREDRFILVIS